MQLNEKQIQELKKKLETMSPEEIEELKEQQMQPDQCPFCLMVEGKIKVNKIYEDQLVIAVLDINPANKGHIILIPKLHYVTSFDMKEEELKHFFYVANELGKKMVETINAQGLNMYLANGEAAGQKVAHFLLHIIPRFHKDGINFTWKPKEVGEEETNQIINAFKHFKLEKKVKIETRRIEDFREEERLP